MSTYEVTPSNARQRSDYIEEIPVQKGKGVHHIAYDYNGICR